MVVLSVYVTFTEEVSSSSTCCLPHIRVFIQDNGLFIYIFVDAIL